MRLITLSSRFTDEDVEVPGIELRQPDYSAQSLNDATVSSLSALEFSRGVLWERKGWAWRLHYPED